MKYIAVVTDLSHAYCRAVVRGVMRYAAIQQGWGLRTPVLRRGVTKELIRSGFDGVIGHLSKSAVADELAGIDLPVVNTSNVVGNLPYPRIGVDDHAVGRTAAEHLVERGFRHLAYQTRDSQLGHGRAAGFIETARSANIEPINLGEFLPSGLHYSLTLDSAKLRAERLRALPKPIGVFGDSDGTAANIINDCRLVGINVPGDIAVIGVDNNEILCNGSFPTISSVVVPGEQIGYRAAEALDRIMRGEQEPGACEPELLQPLGVEARLSTDVQVTESPVVAKALTVIRERACEGLTVAGVLDAVGCSRSTLEKDFRKYLGHTALFQIHRQRLRRAKRLLAETGMTVEAIAFSSGFASSQRMWDIFRKHEGVSPSVFRDASNPVGPSGGRAAPA